MPTLFNVCWEIAEKRYELKKRNAETWSRCLLAACGGTAPSTPASRQASSFATQADAFLSHEVDNRMFSGVVLVTQNGKVLVSRIIILGNLDYTDPVSVANALESMLFGNT